MTYRASDSSSRDCYSKPQSRLNQQIRCDSTDEGCPVLEESGTVCGETNSLGVFQEFRQMYDDCLKKLEGTQDGSATLRKLAPFKKLIDDLWEQNTMLVETVEELEQEATSKVTNLQEKLNKSCQKIAEYEEDIKLLTEFIQRNCEKDAFDNSGLKFNSLCPENAFNGCESSCTTSNNARPTPESLIWNKILNYQDDVALKSICGASKNARGIRCNVKTPFNRRQEFGKEKNSNLSQNCNGGFRGKPLSVDTLFVGNNGRCSDGNGCNSFNRNACMPNGPHNEKNYPESGGIINRNLNLGKEPVGGTQTRSKCLCDCSPSNEPEDN